MRAYAVNRLYPRFCEKPHRKPGSGLPSGSFVAVPVESRTIIGIPQLTSTPGLMYPFWPAPVVVDVAVYLVLSNFRLADSLKTTIFVEVRINPFIHDRSCLRIDAIFDCQFHLELIVEPKLPLHRRPSSFRINIQG